jgi:hypothetical protein
MWLPYAGLANETRAKSRTSSVHHRNYEMAVGGRLVLDTLLDALKFFMDCDPALAYREPDGELAGFPLPTHIFQGYERLHPHSAQVPLSDLPGAP